MRKKDTFFARMDELGLALTYDDVRLRSGYSATMPHEVSVESRFSRNVPVKIPVIAAAMDTVTEHRLATALAKLGGLGVVHRNLLPEVQANEVARVKSHLNACIEAPTCVFEDETVESVLQRKHDEELTFDSFPVLSREGNLVGLLTKTDFDFCDDLTQPVSKIMTSEVLSAESTISLEDAYQLMRKHKKKLLPLLNEQGEIQGLYVYSDVRRIITGSFHQYNLDPRGQLRVAAAVGAGGDAMERASLLVEANVDAIVIDTAHGDSVGVYNTLAALKNAHPDTDIVVGNISEPDSAKRLLEAGADGLKIGQGPGCFAAGTRVLMANGTCKNIEDVVAGDRVIGGHGQAVTVKKAWCTGTREVLALKHTQSYRTTYVTSDHRYWTGDLNSVSRATLTTQGCAKLLDSATRSGESSYKWKQIGEYRQDVALLPRQISFEMPETFRVELQKRNSSDGLNGLEGFVVDAVMEPSYNLGYIFGLFLGDDLACAAAVHGEKSSVSSVRWSFGSHEAHLSDKLVSLLGACFPNASFPQVLTPTEEKNSHQVLFSYKPLADFLVGFGQKDQKHLPTEFLADHEEYLRGLYEGLVDSNGDIENNGRTVFSSTSAPLIELYNVLNFKLFGTFPHNEPHKTNAESSKGSDEESLLPSYRANLALTHEQRHTEDYQVVELTDIRETGEKVPVYDIEVDHEEHSFIADNAIVHNSICTTRIIAGIGSPQVSAVYRSSLEADKFNVPVCADGGLRYSGDITIALGAGASTVMMGSMLAGTTEAPGQEVFLNGRRWKRYRGMGSLAAMTSSDSSKERYRQVGTARNKLVPEGVEGLVPFKGDLEDVLFQYIGGLRSGMGYVGAANIPELQEKADFLRISPAGAAESHAHDIQITKESPNYSPK